tara:strand:+ start:1754 stop:2359 length:606 start_codon:yes stop_codon:yes gene_type:complete
MLSLFLFIAVAFAPVKAVAVSTILLFGDSIIAGYGLPEKHTISTKLEGFFADEGYDVRVINGGVSGDTTGGGLSRLEWALEEHQPDLVFVALGGNDVLRGFPAEATKQNVRGMLDILKQKNVPMILSEVQAPPNMGIKYAYEFNSIYEDLADEYDVPLYPFLLEDIFGKSTYMKNDAIHPNARGIDRIVEDLGPYLVDYID